MIRYLSEDEREYIRPLYEEAFDDSQAFVDYYFHSYVRGRSKCLVAEDSGQIVSMISIHEKRWRMREEGTCTVWYLYGIATMRTHQRQGYMRRLMERILSDGEHAGIAYIYLIPVNPKVYEELGFQLVDKGESTGLDLTGSKAEHGFIWKSLGQAEGEQGQVDIYEDLARGYAAFHQERGFDAYIDKDAEYFREQAMRARLEQGDIYLLYDEDTLIAFATAVVSQEKCKIVEYIDMEQSQNDMWLFMKLLTLPEALGAKELWYERLPVMIYNGAGDRALPQILGVMDEV